SQESDHHHGMLTLTATDSSCSGNGWNVTIQVSTTTYDGGGFGHPIPAENLIAGTPNAPTLLSGQPINVHGGPHAGSGGSLDLPRKVLHANVGSGMGSYEQTIPLTMIVPARSVAGVYTCTLIVSMSVGP
ncbi:MAG: hypothetical protein ACR2J8_02210, partial [Thermomicrobiales bacterium]